MLTLLRLGHLQSDRTRLQNALEIRKDLGPSNGHRLDEMRLRSRHLVRDRELDRSGSRLEFHGTPGMALILQFRSDLVTPCDHETIGRIARDDRAGISHPAIRKEPLPS